MKFFLCVIGMVMIIEGLPYFAFPEKMKHWVATLLEMPNAHLRLMGFLAMGIGLLITYFSRP